MVTYLEYDSALFGYPVAQLDVEDVSSFNLNDIINDFRFTHNGEPGVQSPSTIPRLLYVNSYEPFDIRLPKGLRLGLESERIEFVKNLKNNQITTADSVIDVVNKRLSNYGALLELALLSGQHSRFKIDSNFENNEFEKLYRQWLDKSLNGSFADSVLVYPNPDTPLGMLTLRFGNQDESQIGLIAVSKETQGQGVGRKLLSHAEQLSYENGKRSIRVPTQAQNKGACDFYRRLEYQKDKVTYQYHLWLEEL